jgi:hypothetical protein
LRGASTVHREHPCIPSIPDWGIPFILSLSPIFFDSPVPQRRIYRLVRFVRTYHNDRHLRLLPQTPRVWLSSESSFASHLNSRLRDFGVSLCFKIILSARLSYSESSALSRTRSLSRKSYELTGLANTLISCIRKGIVICNPLRGNLKLLYFSGMLYNYLGSRKGKRV